MAKKIWLSGRNGQGKFAIVDDGDYDELSRYAWYFMPSRIGYGVKSDTLGYAIRMWYEGREQKWVTMHRQIMQPGPGLQVDHHNGDGLDNRRCNMRVCTPKENAQNRRRRPMAKQTYQLKSSDVYVPPPIFTDNE